MSKEEFIKQYGEEKVKFSSYYKYSFTFKNENVSVCVGENADDIYRLEVDADKEYLVKDLDFNGALVNGEYLDYQS